MTREEFLATLKLLDVKKYGGEFRIKGFLLDFTPSKIADYVMLKGRIPYSLAKTIYDQAEKYQLDTTYFKYFYICKDKTHPIEERYIDRIKIDSVDALKFIIETIFEHPYINEWAIGNY